MANIQKFHKNYNGNRNTRLVKRISIVVVTMNYHTHAEIQESGACCRRYGLTAVPDLAYAFLYSRLSFASTAVRLDTLE